MYDKYLTVALSTVLILICAVAGVRAQDIDAPESNPPGENVILQWNRVLAQTLATPGTHPATVRTQRSYAMLHLAMFDAVNSINGSYTPYYTDVAGSSRASAEAAAAKAAHDVLAAIYPTRAAIFATELADSLVGISENRAMQGITVGRTVAERLLALRANDGWSVTPPLYVLPMTPGNWQPTPPANAAAIFTHFSSVVPFALTQGNQFLPVAPPALASTEYADELNEVRTLGSATSTLRTPFQTQSVQLWAAGATTEVNLNSLFRDLALTRNLSTAENARLFALIYLALHDALQTSFTTQYTYGRWRPITAIRRADEDGNPDTTADPTWTPLLNAPATPTYSSNASSLTSSPATMLALYFGRDDVPFQINFGGTPNVIRGYRSFSAMTNEAARSRVLAGIHFHSDTVAGQIAGRNVSNYVFQNFFTRRPKCDQ